MSIIDVVLRICSDELLYTLHSIMTQNHAMWQIIPISSDARNELFFSLFVRMNRALLRCQLFSRYISPIRQSRCSTESNVPGIRKLFAWATDALLGPTRVWIVECVWGRNRTHGVRRWQVPSYIWLQWMVQPMVRQAAPSTFLLPLQNNIGTSALRWVVHYFVIPSRRVDYGDYSNLRIEYIWLLWW
jgi:hypothetical protein